METSAEPVTARPVDTAKKFEDAMVFQGLPVDMFRVNLEDPKAYYSSEEIRRIRAAMFARVQDDRDKVIVYGQSRTEQNGAKTSILPALLGRQNDVRHEWTEYPQGRVGSSYLGEESYTRRVKGKRLPRWKRAAKKFRSQVAPITDKLKPYLSEVPMPEIIRDIESRLNLSEEPTDDSQELVERKVRMTKQNNPHWKYSRVVRRAPDGWEIFLRRQKEAPVPSDYVYHTDPEAEIWYTKITPRENGFLVPDPKKIGDDFEILLDGNGRVNELRRVIQTHYGLDISAALFGFPAGDERRKIVTFIKEFDDNEFFYEVKLFEDSPIFRARLPVAIRKTMAAEGLYKEGEGLVPGATAFMLHNAYSSKVVIKVPGREFIFAESLSTGLLKAILAADGGIMVTRLKAADNETRFQRVNINVRGISAEKVSGEYAAISAPAVATVDSFMDGFIKKIDFQAGGTMRSIANKAETPLARVAVENVENTQIFTAAPQDQQSTPFKITFLRAEPFTYYSSKPKNLKPESVKCETIQAISKPQISFRPANLRESFRIIGVEALLHFAMNGQLIDQEAYDSVMEELWHQVATDPTGYKQEPYKRYKELLREIADASPRFIKTGRTPRQEQKTVLHWLDTTEEEQKMPLPLLDRIDKLSRRPRPHRRKPHKLNHPQHHLPVSLTQGNIV